MSDRVLRSVPEAREEDEPLMRDLIGDVLRRARREQGRTLREVADEAGVSLPYLSEIERGRKEPSSEVLAAVYRALGLQLVDLVGDLHAQLMPQPQPVRPSSPASTIAVPARGPQAMLLAA
ncbi:transcriptional regulator with XRE-family HTH domain [Nocardiopsis mwathae]|uniref:Transcriptional regulator with XRE-family HTH domain n=1 Tax=Nocardiopsis mwathae TaxID=1472723 RepID=A0A7W9YKZ5_9ACTN|nr:helix-turn-helix transcriptional regulator [Nocardiopsis mwathae]MBB6174100.1 transcriptional regulator with XRE-family HTH domain [Nocardiopsis mwathae]